MAVEPPHVADRAWRLGPEQLGSGRHDVHPASDDDADALSVSRG